MAATINIGRFLSLTAVMLVLTMAVYTGSGFPAEYFFGIYRDGGFMV